MDLLRSLPLGLYLEQPITWLHRIDPRVKLAWLMSFLLSPILASSVWRLFLVGFLIVLTIAARIPLRVWKQQMGWLLFFCVAIFCISAFAPDSLQIDRPLRLPPDELEFAQQTEPPSAPEADRRPWYDPFGWRQPAPEANGEKSAPPELPQPTAYRYILFDEWILKMTRRSLELAIATSTLVFTLIYSTNLYLLTTAPEAITAGLEDLMQPLRWFKLPVTEIALTLTLSLRFLPLVLEEIQNLSRSVQTRGINWNKLGFRGAMKIWPIVAERLLENLLLRAEQISSAMQVRGFTSPNEHRVEWHQLRLGWVDGLLVVAIVGFWVGRFVFG
ncbi:MAG: CbiQ family ECF transporter T component [Cyanobacteriota bacterium]|nr:CbiQ family ECF transporter T component [Cyanobacteriota bacterium]